LREPSEISQWLCYDDSTINIVVVIIIIIIMPLLLFITDLPYTAGTTENAIENVDLTIIVNYFSHVIIIVMMTKYGIVLWY